MTNKENWFAVQRALHNAHGNNFSVRSESEGFTLVPDAGIYPGLPGTASYYAGETAEEVAAFVRGWSERGTYENRGRARKVWVLAFDGKYDTDVNVFDSWETMRTFVVNYCRKFWKNDGEPSGDVADALKKEDVTALHDLWPDYTGFCFRWTEMEVRR